MLSMYKIELVQIARRVVSVKHDQTVSTNVRGPLKHVLDLKIMLK